MKLFIIASIAFYVFYKITSFFFRAGAASQQLRNQNQQVRDNSREKNKPGKSTKVKGGEYVDYEEVK